MLGPAVDPEAVAGTASEVSTLSKTGGADLPRGVGAATRSVAEARHQTTPAVTPVKNNADTSPMRRFTLERYAGITRRFKTVSSVYGGSHGRAQIGWACFEPMHP